MSGTGVTNQASRFNERHDGCFYNCAAQTSLDDVRSVMFWKALFAEFFGTFLLVLIGLGSTVQGWQNDTPFDVVQVAFCFGLAVAMSVWIVGHISGGHINPAVTMAMLVTRRASFIRAIMYIVCQCLGSIAAAALMKVFTPAAERGSLGTTSLGDGVTPAMGFGIELCVTMVLVLTVFATCDSKRTDHGGSFPLIIGLSVTMCHLWAVEFCGSSMNPARSLGPAVVMNNWNDHWVYWIGPMSGGIIAGLLYDNLLADNASLRKSHAFITDAEFQAENYPEMVSRGQNLENLDELQIMAKQT